MAKIGRHQDSINKNFNSSKTAVVTIPAPIRFRTNPAFDIFGILTQPLPKTMAFGGVATGNIKANEAANVAGTIKNKGWIFAAIAAMPSIGKITVVVAVFEVNSVKKVTARQITNTVNHKGQSETPVSFSPSHLSSPLVPNPAANAKPVSYTHLTLPTKRIV